MHALDRRQLAMVFHRNVQVSRAEIFGANDPMPMHLTDDAALMFPGYVGRRFQSGGPLLLAINPGGGGDAYQRRTMEDERLYPLLDAFRRSGPDDAPQIFEDINVAFAAIVSRWNLMRILGPVIDAAGAALDEIAYLNAVPYRTRGDKVPSANAKQNAWRLITGPTIAGLRPGMVIALGKKAGDVLERFPRGHTKTFVVPRTIGDTYLSNDACAVIEQIGMQRSRASA